MVSMTSTTANSSTAISSTANSTTVISSNTDTTLFGAIGAVQDNSLTLEEMIIYAIQDEYIARAEYYKIISIFGNRNPYVNIVSSEETHVQMLKPLFAKYNIPLPSDNVTDYLVIPDTFTAALETCVKAEVDNIAMYTLFMQQQIPDDVRIVFNELKSASENHLTAFQNALSK
jgi:hypothetical protein